MNCSQRLQSDECLPGAARGARVIVLLAAGAMVASLCGCASITNPVANGIPARLVPDELLAAPKETLKPIPYTWLRRKPPEVHRLEPGDTLGIYIEGVLGNKDQPPPVYSPDLPNQTPAIGYPIPVGDDGTISLPLVGSVRVEGMTVDQAKGAIEKAYTPQIILPEALRLIVTLLRPRYVTITVLREDAEDKAREDDFTAGYGIGIYTRSARLVKTGEKGTGKDVEMPASQADVLSALSLSGGLPGPTAANEVIVLRGYRDVADAHQIIPRADSPGPGDTLTFGDGSTAADTQPRAVRIPLRWPRGVAPPFRPEDVALDDGDIVFVPALEAQVYYTGGILPSREVPLPRDYDISAVEAVLRVGGPLLNGGVNTSQFTNVLIPAGLGRPSPSLLTVIRHTPGGQQVAIRVNLNQAVRDARENILIQAGDILVLQETPAEAVSRYFSQVFGFTTIHRLYDRGSAVGTASMTVP